MANLVKKVAIFAHYDPQSKIDDYVIFYLEQLKKSVDKIIFVSDCDITDEKELKKLDGLVLDHICKKHGEYDFGSYKRGFELLTTKYKEDFLNLNELVFVNDSCYCLGSFEKIFKDMEMVECDAWGMVDDWCNNLSGKLISQFESKYFLQSWFLVFKKTVFLENFFREFFSGIKKLPQKANIYQKTILYSQLIQPNIIKSLFNNFWEGYG